MALLTLKHMPKLPLVTVGVASFNNARYIVETLDSIYALDYAAIELIIVDDASSDDSVAVIEDWLSRRSDYNGRLIAHATNQGVCRVCNRFVEESRGKYVCFIGSDDIYLPHKLAVQVAIMEAAAPEVGVVFSDISRMNSDGQVTLPHLYGGGEAVPYEGWVWLDLLRLNYVQAMGTLMRRSCFDMVGAYDESLSFEDWDMWLRIAQQFQFIYHSEVTAIYRVHGGSATFQRRAQMAESCLRLLQKQIGLSADGDVIITQHIAHYAEVLYLLDHPDSVKWLTRRWQVRYDTRSLALLVLARMGIPARRMSQVSGAIKRLIGRSTPSV